jgi:hypothetical protein
MELVLVDGSVVTRLRALQPEGIPENLMQETPIRDPADFDPNTYFNVLTHLKVKDGYMLDYVYQLDSSGGNPCLYARPKDARPFDTFVEYRDWNEKNYLLSYLVVDETPDGIFQLVVFNKLAEQFYLHWHSKYNDMTIITSPEEAEATVKSLNGEHNKKITAAQVTALRAIPLEPSVELEDWAADIATWWTLTYCVFTKWGGFARLKEQCTRNPPYMFSPSKVLNKVEYDCGFYY